MLFAIDFI